MKDTVVPHRPLILIAGPCVIESEDHAVNVCGAALEAAKPLGMRLIFKSSFDKANRSSFRSYRGPGLTEGLRILAAVKRRFPVEVTTDIHEAGQARAVAEVVDVIQIPAMLSRQTDLVMAAGRTGRAVNIKKSATMAAQELADVVDKVHVAGGRTILLTERGTAFGYNDLVVDFRNVPRMQRTGFPVIVDVSHPVQRPGLGGVGDAGMIPVLARAAVAVGADGIFVEVHDNPKLARCDQENQLPLDFLPQLLAELARIREALS